jgi:hypothetical protein
MADIRIKDLTTTASTTAADDFFAADGTTNGTRKLSAYSPTFGGNATVGGTLTVTGNATVGGANVTQGALASLPAGAYLSSETSSGEGYLTSYNGTSAAYLPINYRSSEHKFTSNGVVKVQSTTASTSTSSGALVVSGGVGVAGRMHVNGVTTGGDNETHVTFVRNGTVSIGPDSTGTPALVVSTAIKTSAPSGGTAANWKLGTVATVSPTSPNRTIEVEIGGTTYYLHAKTTNN